MRFQAAMPLQKSTWLLKGDSRNTRHRHSRNCPKDPRGIAHDLSIQKKESERDQNRRAHTNSFTQKLFSGVSLPPSLQAPVLAFVFSNLISPGKDSWILLLLKGEPEILLLPRTKLLRDPIESILYPTLQGKEQIKPKTVP